MFNKIIIFGTLLILFLFGCEERKFNDISDCEGLSNVNLKDECFASLVSINITNNYKQMEKFCSKIQNEELRDFCLLKVVQDNWRNMPYLDITNFCQNIKSVVLSNSCFNYPNRSHLRFVY